MLFAFIFCLSIYLLFTAIIIVSSIRLGDFLLLLFLIPVQVLLIPGLSTPIKQSKSEIFKYDVMVNKDSSEYEIKSRYGDLDVTDYKLVMKIRNNNYKVYKIEGINCLGSVVTSEIEIK